MDRKKFKELVMPVLLKETFKTARGTDYTDYMADQLFNAVESELKIISSNLPVSGQLKFCMDDLRKVWDGAKAGAMEKVPVVIDQYGAVNIEEHWQDKYQNFDKWFEQNFNCH